MKTLKLTKKDFKKTDNYWMDYIGKEDISNYDGNVEITCEGKTVKISREVAKALNLTK